MWGKSLYRGSETLAAYENISTDRGHMDIELLLLIAVYVAVLVGVIALVRNIFD